MKMITYICSRHLDKKLVIRGMTNIVAIINPSNENPPAIYSMFPVTTLGKISEIKNNTIPIPTRV
ncbi:hypothetical protein [Enterocloster clostridioformis]|uniref:hypothetical protein n=1 Tax=Enterocloster clostridioformis TaxID=1531 RepID=UPI0034A52680